MHQFLGAVRHCNSEIFRAARREYGFPGSPHVCGHIRLRKRSTWRRIRTTVTRYERYYRFLARVDHRISYPSRVTVGNRTLSFVSLSLYQWLSLAFFFFLLPLLSHRFNSKREVNLGRDQMAYRASLFYFQFTRCSYRCSLVNL